MATITGTSGNDTLTGTTGDDLLSGLGGNDLLRVTAGADTLDGGSGTDTINFTQTGVAYGGLIGVSVNLFTHVADLDRTAPGANSTLISIETVIGTVGNDDLRGGDPEHAPDEFGNSVTETFRPLGGDDAIYGGAGNGFITRVEYTTNTANQPVSVDLGTGLASDGVGGTDTLIRVDHVYGGAGNDILYGGSLERNFSAEFFEIFRGNAGNDTIDGAGTDTVLGARGADRADYGNSPSAVIVNTSAFPYVVGNDTVPGGAARDGWGFTDTLRNITQLRGSIFDDTLVGGTDRQRLLGDAGNDTLVGAVYGVRAYYNAATVGIVANLATGTASDGQGGTDTLINITGLRGSDFDDMMIGNDANNFFIGIEGNDTIDGGAGIDFASYGSALYGLGVNAFIENGSGTVIDQWGSTDTLINIEGLSGSSSNDTLAGGLGDQWFKGGGGSDILDGGAGSDWATYDDNPAGVIVDLASGTGIEDWTLYGYGGTDTLISIENVEGSPFDDVIIGDDNPNELRGGEGNDLLEGRGGNDTLIGGAGDDTLRGGLGDDTLDGGTGFDTADYSQAEGGVVVDLAAGTASGADGNDTLISIEAVSGSRFNDTFIGGAGNDTVSYAYETNPVTTNLATGIATGSGTDTIIGFQNAVGGAAADTLIGSDSANVLDGSGGADTMQGGLGDDTYYVDNEDDVVEEVPNPQQGLVLVAPAALEGFTDMVIAAISYSLQSVADVENLVLAAASAAVAGTGNELDNVLTGNDFNNTLTGLAGNDTIDGGDGTDTAIFSGSRAAYAITEIALGYSVSGGDGDDTLMSIERVRFSDVNVALDLAASQPGGTTVRIIGAAFDAPAIAQHPDWVGIGLGFFDGGMTALEACGFVVGLLGWTDAEFVSNVYRNVAGFDPSPENHALYVGLLQGSGGSMTQAQLLEFAADHPVNELNIDFVGLQQSGVEFV